MKPEKLLEAIGMVGDDLVAEAKRISAPAAVAVKPERDRTVKDWHRYLAAAACLVFAIGMAIIVGTFAKNIPAIFGTDPTNNPIINPPGTTQTDPTEPIDPIPEEITITSGSRAETLSLHAMLWTKTFDTASGTWESLSGDGADGILYKTDWDDEPHLPGLILNPLPEGTVTLHLPENATLNDVRVYQQNGMADYTEKEDFPGTIEALLDLNGSWFVVANVTWQGRFIESEDRYEQHCYEYVFTVAVGQQIVVDNPSGTCGADVEWTLDLATGTLTISGMGRIDDYAVRAPWEDYADNIQKVIIGEDIYAIGAHAFAGCKNLRSVQLPVGLRTIDEYAFFNCTALTDISLPDGISTIGEFAFSECRGLQRITLPRSIDSISYGLFSGCYSLQSVALHDGITTISEYAFDGCMDLKEISIADGVTNIGAYAFRGCASLKSITLSPILQKIDMSTFADCTGLTEIVIPDSVSTIADNAFYGCKNLETVTIGAGVSQIDTLTFRDCHNLKTIIISAENPYFTVDSHGMIYDKAQTKLVWVPLGFAGEYVIPHGITHIAEKAFWHCTSLSAITIPETVTQLGADCFAGCTGLTDITFLGEPPTFGYGIVFSQVTATVRYPNNGAWTEAHRKNYGGNLTWVSEDSSYVPDPNYPSGTCGEDLTWVFNTDTGTLTISGDGEMGDCTQSGWQPYYTQIRHVILEEGVTTVGYFAFSSCLNLISISIPGSVHTIEESAFNGCSSLTAVSLHDGISVIGIKAFAYCTSLTECRIPLGTTIISESAFSGCVALQSVTFHDSITEIAKGAFQNCTSLTAVVIPDSVTKLGDSAFNGCFSLQSVTLGKQIPAIINSTFAGCLALTEIHIPDSVTYLGDNAFSRCTHLQKVSIGSGLKDIRYDVFWDSNLLQEITISEANPHLLSDGFGAIYTKDLSKLVLMAPGFTGEYSVLPGTLSIGAYAFRYCSGLTAITMPDSVTTIDQNAFTHCSNLKSATLSGNLQTIAEQVFMSCYALTEITIPATVTTIKWSVFAYCSNLKQIIFLGSPPEMHKSAFSTVDATVYYHSTDPTWTEEIRKQYGGTLTWVPVEMTP